MKFIDFGDQKSLLESTVFSENTEITLSFFYYVQYLRRNTS